MRHETTGTPLAQKESEPATARFRVTYFDSHCGKMRFEEFDDEAEAGRFARQRVLDENDWSVIDAIPAQHARRAA